MQITGQQRLPRVERHGSDWFLGSARTLTHTETSQRDGNLPLPWDGSSEVPQLITASHQPQPRLHGTALSPALFTLIPSHPIPSVVPPLVPPPNQPQVCSLGQQLRWSSSAGHRDTGTKQGTEQWCRTWDPFQQNQLCFASLSLNPQVTAADNAMVSAAC